MVRMKKNVIVLCLSWMVAWSAVVSESNGQSTISFDNVTTIESCNLKSTSFFPSAVVLDPIWLIFFAFFLLVYLFWAVAYIVERVLMPALNVGIAQQIKLPQSISGASVLALGGSSVPMLFINIMSLSQSPASATGFGMVIGSAAFNFLFVLPTCFFASDWSESPLYWWPLVRDLTVYLLGLGLVGLVFIFGARDWEASASNREDNCWAGQESLCCFQHLENSRSSSVEPVEKGVLVWWEAAFVMVFFLCYLIMLKFHHRLKWAIDSFVEWICVHFLCSDYQRHREENARTKHLREREAHLERGQQLQGDLEKGRKSSSSSKHKTKRKMSTPSLTSTSGAENNSANLLFVLGALGQKAPPAVQRACAIIVLRLGSNSREAFDALDIGHKGVISSEDIDQFVNKRCRDLFGKEFVSSSRSEDLGPRCSVVADYLKVSMSEDETHASTKKTLASISSRPRSSSKSRSQSSGPDVQIQFSSFEKWFTRAEARLVREMNVAFDVLDENGCGEVLVEKLGAALELLGCRPSKKAVRKTREKLEISIHGVIGRSEFDEWYRASMVRTAAARVAKTSPHSPNTTDYRSGYDSDATVATASGRSLAGDAIPSVWGTADGAVPEIQMWHPKGESISDLILHALGLPLRSAVFLTTAMWTGQAEQLLFAGAMLWIAAAGIWIAFFSWVLLFMVESIGLTSGVPDAVLGATVLAIGANSPHLLAAVQRTVNTKNDTNRAYHIIRTFEHTIKGNVFDLVMGLPLAWLIAAVITGHPVFIGASNITSSMGMLALMLALVLFIMVVARWELNFVVASAMLVLYFLWGLQDILLADWSKPVPAFVQCSGCRAEMVCANI